MVGRGTEKAVGAGIKVSNLFEVLTEREETPSRARASDKGHHGSPSAREEEEKKITHATTARSSVFCVTPQSASTRGVYTFWILDRVL